MANLTKLSGNYSDQRFDKLSNQSQLLYLRLLREVFTVPTPGHSPCYDDSYPREYLFPSQIDATRLSQIIRREFRLGKNSVSVLFDEETRRNVAFMALRELNKKVELATSLQQRAADHPLHPMQAARNVSILPFDRPSTYLRPGAFLLAHPRLRGLFARSVICILSHTEGEGEEYRTYGLVINKINIDFPTGEPHTLADVIRSSNESVDAFRDSIVRDGGPVQPSFQIVYSRSPGENVAIGGTPLPTIASLTDDSDNKEKSLALDSDREVYFQGDMRAATQAVKSGELKLEDISFYVGASVWEPCQLEKEVNRGVWIPCRAPTSLVVTGKCEHEAGQTDGGAKRWKGKPPKEDIWLSMMCALGKDEATLAHFADLEDKFDRQLAAPCDLDIG